ncbi:MAG: prefoldin subunit alpha [Nitrososphaerota archaeon]
MSIKVTREDVERAVSELGVLERVVRELQARVLALESSISEHDRSLELLDEIAKSQSEVKGLMPIGAGVLVEGVITNINTYRVNIGENIFIDMPLDRCRSWLMLRKQRLEQARAETSRALQAYLERIEAIRRFLSTIERAAREGQGEAGRS